MIVKTALRTRILLQVYFVAIKRQEMKKNKEQNLLQIRTAYQ